MPYPGGALGFPVLLGSSPVLCRMVLVASLVPTSPYPLCLCYTHVSREHVWSGLVFGWMWPLRAPFRSFLSAGLSVSQRRGPKLTVGVCLGVGHCSFWGCAPHLGVLRAAAMVQTEPAYPVIATLSKMGHLGTTVLEWGHKWLQHRWQALPALLP